DGMPTNQNKVSGSARPRSRRSCVVPFRDLTSKCHLLRNIITCAKLTEAEIDFLSTNNQWNCASCTAKKRLRRSLSDSCPVQSPSPSQVTKSSTSIGLTIEDLKPLLEDMKREILKGQNNIEKEINKSIEMCFSMIKENSEIVAKQQEIITSQQTKIEGLEEENKYLRAQVKDISRRQSDLDQYSRRNTLE
ncbi:hypothetical protein J6590_104924, partial [Homalodisca vitripennis]